MDSLTFFAYFDTYPGTFWLVFAVVLVIIEVSTPGIGFLFSAIAALALGSLMSLELLNPGSFYLEIAYFFGLTTLFAIILWKPMKKFVQPKEDSYEGIIGTSATVINKPIVKIKTGQIKWSGTFMQATLKPDSNVDSIAIGEEVWVHGRKGIKLIVDSVPVGTNKKEQEKIDEVEFTTSSEENK